jgi:hypothetical protein
VLALDDLHCIERFVRPCQAGHRGHRATGSAFSVCRRDTVPGRTARRGATSKISFDGDITKPENTVVTAAKRSISLLVPGLFGPRTQPDAADPANGLSLPALETLLGRGLSEAFAASGLEAALFALFGADTPPDADLPVAAVTRVVDRGVGKEGYWLRADPVHLVPNRDQLMLAGTEPPDISLVEARQLAAEINAAMGARDGHLEAPSVNRWYLHLDADPGIRTVAPAQAVGRNVGDVLPRGAQARRWHAWMNEIQMALHGSAVNAAREDRGAPVVNSLWLWGGGRLPILPSDRWAQVWSNNPLAEGLARLSGTPVARLPGTGGEWLEMAVTPGRHLVVLDEGAGTAPWHRQQAWAAIVRTVELDWLTALLPAIRAGVLEALTLFPLAGRCYHLDRRALRRWWRRRVPLVRAARGETSVPPAPKT